MVTVKITIILVELCILIFYQIYRKSKLHIKSNCNELNTDLDEKKKSIFNKCKKHLKYILPGVLTLMLVLMANYSKAKYVEVKSIDAEITFIKMYYENVETGEKFLTLAEAVNKAATDEPTAKNTIKVINSRTEENTVIIPEGKEIELDTNGKTIIWDKPAIENNGILTISGQGKIIGNDNYLKSGIVNKENGKLIVSDVTIETEGVSIRNYSSVNTESSPSVKIISGTIKSNGRNAVVNDSTATGLIVIDGGNISSDQTEDMPTVLNYQGKIIINGGEILSSNNRAVCQYQDSKGIIEIRSGTIIGSIGIAVNAGAIKVTGGNISATDTYGARVSGTGTLTFGINEEVPNVSIVTPSVTGETGGVLVYGEGIFNFYDGVIKGQSGSGSAINGIVKDVPTGYVVTKTIDETIETAALGPSAPIITAKLNNSSGNTYTSGNWTNKNVYISVNSENVGAGIKEYQWYENGTWTTRTLTTSNNVGTITYTAARNETIRFRAIDNNGAISQEATLSVKIDKTLPTIIVTPANATVCKSKSITITIKDEGGSSLSSSNSYQYYLSSSSTALSGGSWKDYTSGTAFTIGSGITGTRYLFVKRVSDNAGNTSTANGTATTISNVTYQRFGSYVFDNTKPTAIINTESMYVTDGLVTRLDGVNNNGGSHSASVTTWKDLSSNGKNGTITNGTWGTNYLDFNGTSSWVNLGEINNDYQTVEVTFSPDVVPTSQQCIIGNWEAGGGGIYIDFNGRICGQYYIDGSYKLITSKVRVVTNQKYHAACTYNGTTMVLYVNGVEQGRISVSGTILVPNNSTVMALGANPNGANATTAYFDGKIYNAAVYNKALTAAQAKTNADAGKALVGGPTNASNITYTIRFNEAVTGFTTDDVTITNGMKGAFTEVTAGRVYKVAVTTSANQNNTQTIALTANGCTDSAGNGIAATNKTIVIDRVAPTVTLSANGGTYNIIPGNTTISVNTTPTASDTGSGIAGLSYAWGASNSQEPSTWTEFTSGTAITKALSGGNNYLWTNVIDNAGNRATSIKTSSAFIVRYQVVFNANGGTGAPSTQNKVHGTALTLSSTKPTRTGYTFKEWNTKADGTGTKYAPGASYTANSAVTLYAQWTANELTFNAQSKSSYYNTAAKTVSITGASNGTGTYTYGISSQKNSGGTAVSYFTISGTTITVKASTPVGKYIVVVKATDSGSSKTKEATITITIQYPKLTLNANGGTATQAAVYPKYGTTSKYTAATGSTAGTIGATRTGYTLNGWYTAASGGTKVLNADGTGTGTAVSGYTNASKQFVMTANKTLYAQWKKNNYEGRNRSGTTIEYYTTLNEAFSTTNAIVYEIKPLNNVTETQDAIVPSGKSFRVNGDYQINMNEHAIINNGILEIIRVPIVAAKADVAVKNTGILTCSNEINTNGTAILCTGSGNVRLNGGTIVSSGIGIDFQSSGILSIAGDSNINTSGDAIKMTKGSLEYVSGIVVSKLAGISLNDSIDVIIRGGKISGDNGIWIASTISPTINIIGGEIEGITMDGIASYGTAIVTIGETKSTSATTPSIKGADIGVAMYGGKATMNAGVLSAKNNTLYGSVSPKEGYRFVHSSGVGGYNKTIVQAVAKTTSTTNTTSEEIPIQNITDDTSTAALNNVVEIEPESAQKIENIDNSINTEADKIIKKIAKINETTYPTISEAIASANSGEKIELLEDITLNEEVIVEEDKNIIINLNGKTLTSSSSSTINNKGILKIVGTGNIRNEIDNGVVVNNNGSLKIENGTITTTEKGGKCINNNGKLEINSTSIVKIIVSSDDSIGIYNSKESIACDIKSAEVIIKAEDYDKAKIEQIKPSYGIYNDGNISVNIEGLTMKVERLKGIGIQNNAEGVITIGKNDGVINEFNPIIYATSDNTTAIVNVNTQKGRIKFYDGSFITTNSIKNEITDVLEGYEVFEVENDGKIKSSLRHTEE